MAQSMHTRTSTGTAYCFSMSAVQSALALSRLSRYVCTSSRPCAFTPDWLSRNFFSSCNADCSLSASDRQVQQMGIKSCFVVTAVQCT